MAGWIFGQKGAARMTGRERGMVDEGRRFRPVATAR
jgi:hypothetical protein